VYVYMHIHMYGDIHVHMKQNKGKYYFVKVSWEVYAFRDV
jgi:hypothetical protein